MAAGRARAGANPQSCDECFFRKNNLCALGLDEPCPTFRPDTPAGLAPPRQPSLLMRAAEQPRAGALVAQAA